MKLCSFLQKSTLRHIKRSRKLYTVAKNFLFFSSHNKIKNISYAEKFRKITIHIQSKVENIAQRWI